MKWMNDASKIYDYVNSGNNIPKSDDMVPICHVGINSHIEITINEHGEFINAVMVEKADALIHIPCTEESANRTGSCPKPHVLSDKLQFLACDFADFGGIITKGFMKNPSMPYLSFMSGLDKWCKSKYANKKVIAVYKYLSNRTIISDIKSTLEQVMFKDGKFAEKYNEPSKYASQGDKMSPLVRWRVEVSGDLESRLWKDKSVQQSWIDYYVSTLGNIGFCYVTGKIGPISILHPSRLRHNGDSTKLISSNDSNGYTFRGRFNTAQEACSIGFEVSQKSHNALRWLISRQGLRFGGRTYAIWSCENIEDEIVNPFANTEEIMKFLDGDFDAVDTDILEDQVSKTSGVSLPEIYVSNLKKSMKGYGFKIKNSSHIHMVAIDSFSSTGRIALVEDREISKSQLLDNLLSWHTKAAWPQRYGKSTINGVEKFKNFIGAPSPRDIVFAMYGDDPKEKLVSSECQRIIPSIIDGKPLPIHVVRSVVNSAFKRVGKTNWQWEKQVGIACSIYCHANQKEEYKMKLENTRNSRDYLWGRLLALAEVTERYALTTKRPTAAERLFATFVQQPTKTWTNIELALKPYLINLRCGEEKDIAMAIRFEKISDEIVSMFKNNGEDFTNNKQLSGEALLGYHCQRYALYFSNKPDANNESNKNA
jgi:CRISPR-associated protein Csd1